jgi:hypothetical protein
MKTAPQVLDLETRRMEKEARRRIEDVRAVMGRLGEEAKRALSALLDGKLTFTPRPDRRYEITGRVVTGALVPLPERPQGDTRYCEHEWLRWVGWMDGRDQRGCVTAPAV